MRKKVRGLRKIEQAVLEQHATETSKSVAEDDPEPTVTAVARPSNTLSPEADSASAVVLEHARRCVVFSTTIREDHYILPACEWPRHWMMSGHRSNGT